MGAGAGATGRAARWRTAVVVALVVAAGVAAGLGPSPVGAQEAEPTLVVSPSTDLVDGQVVQV